MNGKFVTGFILGAILGGGLFVLVAQSLTYEEFKENFTSVTEKYERCELAGGKPEISGLSVAFDECIIK